MIPVGLCEYSTREQLREYWDSKKHQRVDPEKALVTGSSSNSSDSTILAKRLEAVYIVSVTLTVGKKFNWVVYRTMGEIS